MLYDFKKVSCCTFIKSSYITTVCAQYLIFPGTYSFFFPPPECIFLYYFAIEFPFESRFNSLNQGPKMGNLAYVSEFISSYNLVVSVSWWIPSELWLIEMDKHKKRKWQ